MSPRFTDETKQSIQMSLRVAQQLDSPQILPEHVLVAIALNTETTAGAILADNGIVATDLIERLRGQKAQALDANGISIDTAGHRVEEPVLARAPDGRTMGWKPDTGFVLATQSKGLSSS